MNENQTRRLAGISLTPCCIARREIDFRRIDTGRGDIIHNCLSFILLVVFLALTSTGLAAFDPQVLGTVNTLAVQPDGKIVIGGFQMRSVDSNPRTNLARLFPDGTVDPSFSPIIPAGGVNALAIQDDGKILVGGSFAFVNGQPATNLVRLHTNGVLDSSFNSRAGVLSFARTPAVYCLFVQPDGKILVGGEFWTMGGQSRTNITRLNADGSADTSFVGLSTLAIYSMAVQEDGKILVAGYSAGSFTTPEGLARLGTNGTVDPTFAPDAISGLWPIALQANGKVLAGGIFTTQTGQLRTNLVRFNTDGSVDGGFRAGTLGQHCAVCGDLPVASLAVRADGRINVGGSFTNLGGQSCRNVARLTPEGSFDSALLGGASGTPGTPVAVRGLALGADGMLLACGSFNALGGEARPGGLGDVPGSSAAQDSLTVEADGTSLLWQRGGGGPEVGHVTISWSRDGISYSPAGRAHRVEGGWRLSGVSLPAGSGIFLRARGRAPTGRWNGSSSLYESVVRLNVPPLLSPPTRLENGQLQFTFTDTNASRFSLLASTNLTSPLSNWIVLGSPAASGGLFKFIDVQVPTQPRRFYRLRVP